MENEPNLYEIYSQYCSKLIMSALNSLQGQDPGIVRDEGLYRQKVIEPCWNYLPLPLRMFGRDKLRWDEYFLALRLDAFRAFDGKLAIRQDIVPRMQSLAQKLFGTGPTQVAAPPQVARPVEPSSIAIGIDLGTTYSASAYLDGHGRPTTIMNATGDLTTPSIVLFDSEGPVVGKEAFMAAGMEPEKVAILAKRDMGNAVYRRKINNEHLPPEVINSIILRSLKADAERKLGPISKAVITVPAYFDEARRRATMDAGRLAGLEVLDIINEPTAAAIAYGYQVGFLDKTGQFQSGKPMRVLVYDLGGGTFDVTVLEINGTDFKTIATDGDVTLGGADWDERILDTAAERFKQAHREDPRDNPHSFTELWFACETAKKTLSERNKASIYINYLGLRMKVDISRDEFEEATSPLLGRTRTTTEIVLRQAGLRWADIDTVLLVGGSTRMPMVARMLQEVTGKQPERSVSPDEAVAHGAALYANLLLRQQNRNTSAPAFSITNVNSHSLGIVGLDPQTGRRKNQILIPKNTPLPHSVTRVFRTQKPNQPNVVIRVVEGESERPDACSQVGVATISDLPANLPAGTPVMVSYAYAANGQLTVTGQVKGMNRRARSVFQRENTMKETDLQMWGQFVEQTQNE